MRASAREVLPFPRGFRRKAGTTATAMPPPHHAPEGQRCHRLPHPHRRRRRPVIERFCPRGPPVPSTPRGLRSGRPCRSSCRTSSPGRMRVSKKKRVVNCFVSRLIIFSPSIDCILTQVAHVLPFRSPVPGSGRLEIPGTVQLSPRNTQAHGSRHSETQGRRGQVRIRIRRRGGRATRMEELRE